MIERECRAVAYDAIVFDMDGVLITGAGTSPETYRRATTELLSVFGHPEPTDWSSQLEDPSNADSFREACDRWDLPPEAAWAYKERAATDVARARIAQGERTTYDDIEVVPTLADRYDLGIVSNNRIDTVQYCADRFEWSWAEVCRGRFPTLTDFDARKPDPTYLEWAFDRMECETALYVGDRISDMMAAERAGVDAALLTRSGKRDPESPIPTYEISSLRDLLELEAAG